MRRCPHIRRRFVLDSRPRWRRRRAAVRTGGPRSCWRWLAVAEVVSSRLASLAAAAKVAEMSSRLAALAAAVALAAEVVSSRLAALAAAVAVMVTKVAEMSSRLAVLAAAVAVAAEAVSSRLAVLAAKATCRCLGTRCSHRLPMPRRSTRTGLQPCEAWSGEARCGWNIPL